MARTFEYSGGAESGAAPSQVWAVLADPSTYESWWGAWHSASGEAPLSLGATVTMHTVDHDPDVGGASEVRRLRNLPMKVIELEEPRRLTILNKSVGEERFIFTLNDSPPGTRIEYRRETRAPRLLSFLGRAMRGRLEAEAAQSAAALAKLAGERSAG